MPPLSIMIKPASGLCNLRCDYCFYCDEMQNRERGSYGVMPISVLEAVTERALSYADDVCNIAFQGGEPTIAGPEFFKQAIASQRRYNVKSLKINNAIQTNGVWLDKEWAEFFSSNGFLVGLSLDGIKNTHDAFRKSTNGGETFSRVMDTALLFDKYRVQYNILTVVTAKTAVNAKRIYQFYRRRGFKYLQFIACLEPLEDSSGTREYTLTPEAYGMFLCELFDLWYNDLLCGEQPYIRSFENYIGILCGIEPESCDMRGVCSNQYVVEADGSVYPCDFYSLDRLRLGNLVTDDFAVLDNRRKELDFIKSSEKRSDCTDCRWFNLCRGGCMRNRDSDSKNRFCEGYRQFFEYSGERMREIAEAICIGG